MFLLLVRFYYDQNKMKITSSFTVALQSLTYYSDYGLGCSSKMKPVHKAFSPGLSTSAAVSSYFLSGFRYTSSMLSQLRVLRPFHRYGFLQI